MDMTIQIYNTLSRQKEEFQTVHPGKVGIYLCGPTVYKPSHIGHMVGPVIFDTVKRYLVYSGYQVTWIVNITDVDDKLIAEASRREIPMAEVAEEMTRDYLDNLALLHVDQIDQLPKATDHIEQIIEFTGQLIERGFAYEVDGDVFFDVASDEDYGKLSNRSSEDQQGAGGEAADRKRSPADFAIWKAAKPQEPGWQSPWGTGRPGWHIECSAMSRHALGETFDIHGGGLDLVFPHHENEIAQSESCHGAPMARYWMHNGLTRAESAGKVGGRTEREATEQSDADVESKISRSRGAGGLAELIALHGGERIRFFLLRTHYRSTIVFSEAEIEQAGVALESFYRFFERYQRITGDDFYQLQPTTSRADGDLPASDDPLLGEAAACRSRFLAWMDDDFNTAGATSELFELLRLMNRFVDETKLEDPQARTEADLSSLTTAAGLLKELGQLLGLFLEEPAAAGGGEVLVEKLRELSLELSHDIDSLEFAERIQDAEKMVAAADNDRSIDLLVQLLIQCRADSRTAGDYGMADRIRDELAKLGINLEDRTGETGWRFD
jgi:cysteinyl-tRNA synthetase